MGEVRPRLLIDSFAPHPDAVETHSIIINAGREAVYRALWTADLGGSFVIKVLLALRSLPGFVSRGFRELPRNQRITLQTLIDSGFGVLLERPAEEIVIGVAGKVLGPAGNFFSFNRGEFCCPLAPRVPRTARNFPRSGGVRGKSEMVSRHPLI